MKPQPLSHATSLSENGNALKNRILLENYYLPGYLEADIGRFVEHDNHRRYHDSLSKL
jgi:hypothetical protein